MALIERPLYVTIPLEAANETVPSSVPSPVCNVAVTVNVLSVTVFPNASWIVTTGCCANATPSTVLAEGCVVTASLFAAANVIVSLAGSKVAESVATPALVCVVIVKFPGLPAVCGTVISVRSKVAVSVPESALPSPRRVNVSVLVPPPSTLKVAPPRSPIGLLAAVLTLVVYPAGRTITSLPFVAQVFSTTNVTVTVV